MSIVTIGDFKNYLQTVANAVSSGKMNVNDAEVKSVLQTIAAAVGEVSATPTANTLADRLKAIADRLGEASANPTANTALARLKALEGYLDGVEAALGAQADAEATGNGSLIAIVKRLRTILTDVWNDAANALNVQLTGSNVPDAQAIPAKIMSTYDQTRIVKLSTDTIVAAGANYDWNITGTDYNQLRKFPFFAVVLSWKVGSSNLNWDFSVWQYMTYSESFSNTIPDSIAAIDSLPVGATNRLHAGRFRNLGNSGILIRVRNKSSQDQILTNLYVVGLDAI